MLIDIEFSSKNLMLNFSRFSGGIGFRILFCVLLLGVCVLLVVCCMVRVERLGNGLSLGLCGCLL